MKEPITSYVGLDIHKDSIAIAVAEAGRAAPLFIGTTAAELAQLCKALRRSADAPCAASTSSLAVTFVAEIGDLQRFAHPRALMAYLGLVPSEYSSGQTRHQGRITKAGNTHARRILVEAAWNYRFKPQVSRCLEVRQQCPPKALRDNAWRAQLRLTERFRRLSLGRRLPQNKVCVATARELTDFVWDVARQVTITA